MHTPLSQTPPTMHLSSPGYYWTVLVFTGTLGFLINIAIFMQIKFTSPLTNNISGTATAPITKMCIKTV